MVDPNDAAIEWEPVTTRFIGSGPIDIAGYQVIVEQVEPFRMLTINLPPTAHERFDSTGVSRAQPTV